MAWGGANLGVPAHTWQTCLSMHQQSLREATLRRGGPDERVSRFGQLPGGCPARRYGSEASGLFALSGSGRRGRGGGRSGRGDCVDAGRGVRRYDKPRRGIDDEFGRGARGRFGAGGQGQGRVEPGGFAVSGFAIGAFAVGRFTWWFTQFSVNWCSRTARGTVADSVDRACAIAGVGENSFDRASRIKPRHLSGRGKGGSGQSNSAGRERERNH